MSVTDVAKLYLAGMYHLLFGMSPWFKDISKFKADRTKAEDVIIEERKKPISFPKVSEDIVDFDASVLKVLKKALQNDPENRFQSANEFTQALNGEIEIEDVDTVQKVKSDEKNDKKIKTQKAKGKGFDAIAGMKELKAQLQLDVIDALHKPEEYAKYGVTIPNGMLLYGPPGCGKTFFAKHFAEEVGFNFMLATPSTLKSRFINATQENIAKMFEEAEKNAPTIIFIDEINELLPIEYSEIKFFKNIRHRLKVSDDNILAVFPDIEQFLEEDIVTESFLDKITNQYLEAAELPQFELISIDTSSLDDLKKDE